MSSGSYFPGRVTQTQGCGNMPMSDYSVRRSHVSGWKSS